MTLSFSLALACALLKLAMPGPAIAQDPAQGLALAERHCARCHAVREQDESRMPRAPAFRDLARRYNPDNLAEALAEGIVVGHPLMPEFVLEPEEIGALIAYFHTLAPEKN